MMEFSLCATANIIMAMTFLIQYLPSLSSTPIGIGVNLGLNGDNLPSPGDTINLYNRCQINFIRIFEPRHEILDALRNKPTFVSLGVRDQDLQTLASDQSAANQWVKDNVVPYIPDVNIGYITLGNEVIPGPQAQYVAQAINNINAALTNARISKDIKVTTVISSNTLFASYPPSAGTFNEESASALKNISTILSGRGSPIMVNVYPYFAYVADPEHIRSDYALFTSQGTVVTDGDYSYQNLFDAIVDSFFAAFEKIGASGINLAVAETGWPSAGNEPYTSIKNARTYNKNMMDHVLSGKGTPRRPNRTFNAFLFEMFNEDQKPAGVEQNFGLFNPNMQPVYPLWPC
ncbi:glucan endo-1,3-beta-glucosidase [Ziziphus jujuba]|uniref:glucan endo-1,3-beta-D-glucosidase n=1 Tax=Ziziphus jujuba TaxID=326968 RepID=A0A6P6FN70_ZIZJJ|nr:glucan endo-1,3-beta-glucosidase [Ziziphus jujuba]